MIMNQAVEVEILIATYNGEKYLPAQLDSILAQTHQDFRILIRDDGSTDATVQIIQDYQQQHPGKINLIPPDNSAPGLILNFSKLIAASTAPFLMLSDQDDVWLPKKIESMLTRIKQLEKTHPPKTPVLIHSDLIVVDSQLTEIDKSFWRYIGINPNRATFANILIQNNVTGCASIFNRALAEVSIPIPPEAMMHDWWLALVASSMGVLDHVKSPTVLYRQHGANTLGAQPFAWSIGYFLRKIRTLFQPQKNYILTTYIQQAELFFQHYQHHLPDSHKKTLAAFKDIKSQGFLARRLTLIRYNLVRWKFVQNIGLFIRI